MLQTRHNRFSANIELAECTTSPHVCAALQKSTDLKVKMKQILMKNKQGTVSFLPLFYVFILTFGAADMVRLIPPRVLQPQRL